MRVLVAALLAACGSQPAAPSPVRYVDRTVDFGLPLHAAPCAVAADLDGDGEVDLFTADSDEQGRSAEIYKLRIGVETRAVASSSPIHHIGACAASPSGKLAISGDAVLVDGAAVYAPATPFLRPALAWIDGDRLLIGSADGPQPTFDCHPDPFGCTFTFSTARRAPFWIWTAAGGMQLAGESRMNRADVATWNGRKVVVLAEDYGQTRVLDAATLETIVTLPTYGGMGATVYGDRMYVADFGIDALYSLDGRRTDVVGSAWHSGWSPIAADFNHDGVLDLFVPSPMSATSAADFFEEIKNPSPTLQEDVFLLGPDLTPQRVPHRYRLAPNPSICATAMTGRWLLVACNIRGAGELRLLEIQ